MSETNLSREELRHLGAILGTRKDRAGGEHFEMPCEITACIPVFNGIMWLPWALGHLGWGAQSVPISLIVAENGSRDGVQAFIRELGGDTVTRAHWAWKFHDIRVVEVPQNEEYPARFPREFVNQRECYLRMFDLVETPYILTVDADVCAPLGSIRTMFEALVHDESLGMVGITYTRETRHLQGGLLMVRAELLKELTIEHLNVKQCMCAQFQAMVKHKGFRVADLSPLSARHTRDERVVSA